MWTWNPNGTITAGLTGQCLDQYFFNTFRVDVWDCNGGANQQWSVLDDLTIRNQLSGQCLTATYQWCAVRTCTCHQY